MHIFLSQFDKLLHLAAKNFKNVIITGDLNINQFSNDINTMKLFDLIHSFKMVSLITTPTRIFTNINYTSSSSIDYVISNVPHILKTKNFDPGISDHHCQTLELVVASCDIKEHTNDYYLHTYRIIKERSLLDFKERFAEFQFKEFNNSNVNRLFDKFLGTFLWCFDIACPKRKRNISNSNKGDRIPFSIDLYQKRKLLQNLNWLRKRIYDENLIKRYQTLKREIKHQIILEKKNYYKNLINNSSNKNKTSWNLVNKVKCKQTNTKIKEINYKNKTLTCSNDMAAAFGQYLSTDIVNKISDHFGSNLSKECTISESATQSMFFTSVSSDEVIEIISSLPNKNSTGLDEVPVSAIKYCKELIAPHITNIINVSIKEGQFPSALKLASVTLLHKKGDPSDVANYRPIAVLSTFSKIIEKVVAKRVYSYLNKFQLITNCQHGFRNGFSTESSIAEYIQFVNSKLDVGEYVVSIFFDLTRAFDTVDKAFVSDKLYNLGIRGSINNWFVSFLEERRIMVRVNNVLSDEFKLDLGTPQGSVLGPLYTYLSLIHQ
uniref:Reverse transcriptase domain-containing protein n=1 Tax=Photinus pyralis TaxID=7054 RepID=A0A1Y1NIN0_PHOPY